MLNACAPDCEAMLDYDRRNLLTYVELLDADRLGVSWEAAALEILGIDPVLNASAAQRCWDSHLERARWITGAGLSATIVALDAATIR